MLGVEATPWEQSGLRGVLTLPLRVGGGVLSDLIHDSKLIADLAEKVGKLLINSIVLLQRNGNRPAFAIPKDLQQQWGVNWVS